MEKYIKKILKYQKQFKFFFAEKMWKKRKQRFYLKHEKHKLYKKKDLENIILLKKLSFFEFFLFEKRVKKEWKKIFCLKHEEYKLYKKNYWLNIKLLIKLEFF